LAANRPGRTLRILHVAEALGGGVYEILRILTAGLAARGHTVGLAYGIRPETPEALAEELDPGVELFPTPWTSRSAGAQIRAGFALRRLAQRWRPDVVHLHSTFAAVVGCYAIDPHIPSVYTPQAYSFTMTSSSGVLRRMMRMAEGRVSRRVDVVAGSSESEAALARGLGARVVEVVANGIPELSARSVYGAPSSSAPASPDELARTAVIALGRTVPQRQPMACARILAALAPVADVAWVGGAGGGRGRDGAAALTAAGIPLTGWMPREAVIGRLATARAYLHWTAWDGLALSILEALALDTVVVASDIPPNREVLGERQVCATEGDAVSLLRRVVSDAGFAAELLDSQRRRRERYGAERMVNDAARIYRRLVEAGA